MSGDDDGAKVVRPPLPRDGFRGQRVATSEAAPVVITPDYGDGKVLPTAGQHVTAPAQSLSSSRAAKAKPVSPRNPFDAYGERTSSRPYALRLPDAIDLVLRQMAAEERTHPLRIVDRILYDHLKKMGRLPPLGT